MHDAQREREFNERPLIAFGCLRLEANNTSFLMAADFPLDTNVLGDGQEKRGHELFTDPAFMTDEFRIYQMKITRCPRARPHDWTSCPFAHPVSLEKVQILFF